MQISDPSVQSLTVHGSLRRSFFAAMQTLRSTSEIYTGRRYKTAHGLVQGSHLLSETAAERNTFYTLSVIWN